MRDRCFLRMIQHRTARVAVGASTVRGQGAPGIVAAARHFVGELPLTSFGTDDQRVFARRLEATTQRLMTVLPRRASAWGLSRKVLNIFLRDCLYTSYLAEAYRLTAAEHILEIPLDSLTAKSIRAQVPGLPRWPGVRYLKPTESLAYQSAARVTLSPEPGPADMGLLKAAARRVRCRSDAIPKSRSSQS